MCVDIKKIREKQVCLSPMFKTRDEQEVETKADANKNRDEQEEQTEANKNKGAKCLLCADGWREYCMRHWPNCR